MTFIRSPLIAGYGLKLHPMENQNMQAAHLGVGTPMIPFAGRFLKKISCKVLKSYLTVYMFMDMRYKECGCP